MWTTRQTAYYKRSSLEAKRLRRQLVSPLMTLLMVSLWVLGAVAAPVEDLAAEGDEAYRNGQFDRAVDIYERVLTGGYISGPLFYNLGNAYYKSGNIGRAILNYERAKRLMPHSSDVRYNLELASSRTVDRVEVPPRLPVWNLVDTLRDLVSRKQSANIAWAFTLLAALFLAIQLQMRGILRRLFRIITTVLAVFALTSLLLIGLRVAADHGPPEAVILADKVEVRSAPDITSLEVFALHTGTKITIVKRLEDWWEIRLADGRQGWMPNAAAEIIQVF